MLDNTHFGTAEYKWVQPSGGWVNRAHEDCRVLVEHGVLTITEYDLIDVDEHWPQFVEQVPIKCITALAPGSWRDMEWKPNGP